LCVREEGKGGGAEGADAVGLAGMGWLQGRRATYSSKKNISLDESGGWAREDELEKERGYCPEM